MTMFLVPDEFERDFEQLEESDFEAYKAAVTLWVSLGQRSAKRMTDGLVSLGTLRKATALWPEADVQRGVEALVRIGMWAAVEGGYQFVAWDHVQPTRDAEERRRERAREKKRAQRAAQKVALERSGVRAVPGDRPAASPAVPHVVPAVPGTADNTNDETIGQIRNVPRDVPASSPSSSKKKSSSNSSPSQEAPGNVRRLNLKVRRAKPPRSRKPSNLDLAKRRVEDMFHERYLQNSASKVRSTLGGRDELQALQKAAIAYMGGDTSAPLGEALVGAAMDAYFADPWRTTASGGKAPPGFSLSSFLRNHAKYDQIAARSASYAAPEGDYDYGF